MACKAILKSMGTDGAKAWEIKVKNRSKLRAVVDYWRRFCWLMGQDRVRN